MVDSQTHRNSANVHKEQKKRASGRRGSDVEEGGGYHACWWRSSLIQEQIKKHE